MRREDRRLTDQETIEILQKAEFGVLSMCTPDNGYGIPLNFAFVDNSIYFHCATEGSKLDYLRINNKVSFCAVGKTEMMPSKFGTKYESAIVSGYTIEIEGDEKHEALMHLIKKYSVGYMEEGKEYINKLYDRVKVVKLSVETITGKARKH